MNALKIETAENGSKEFMEESNARRLTILEKEANDIRSEFETRARLHTALNDGLGRNIESREFEIRRFGGWGSGSIFETRIVALERDISDFKKEIRIEELSYWHDLSRLKETLRKVLKEYWNLKSKKEFVNKYLNKLNIGGDDY